MDRNRNFKIFLKDEDTQETVNKIYETTSET